MTQTNNNPALSLLKSPVYDTVGSLLVLRVYFKYAWKDARGNTNNSIPYYMKYLKESGYEGIHTEFPRVFVRINGIVNSDNPFKTILLYQNHNKGRTVQNVVNPEVFKIVETRGQLVLTYSDKIADNVKDFVKDKFEALKMLYHG